MLKSETNWIVKRDRDPPSKRFPNEFRHYCEIYEFYVVRSVVEMRMQISSARPLTYVSPLRRRRHERDPLIVSLRRTDASFYMELLKQTHQRDTSNFAKRTRNGRLYASGGFAIWILSSTYLESQLRYDEQRHFNIHFEILQSNKKLHPSFNFFRCRFNCCPRCINRNVMTQSSLLLSVLLSRKR